MPLPCVRGSELPIESWMGQIKPWLGGDVWLVDTGAPGSLGDPGRVSMCGRDFEMPRVWMGISASMLAMTNTNGNVGSEFFRERVIGYFSRKGILWL